MVSHGINSDEFREGVQRGQLAMCSPQNVLCFSETPYYYVYSINENLYSAPSTSLLRGVPDSGQAEKRSLEELVKLNQSLHTCIIIIFAYWRKEHVTTVGVAAYEQQALKNVIKLVRYLGLKKY